MRENMGIYRGKRLEKSVWDKSEWVVGSFIDSGNHSQVAIFPPVNGASTMRVSDLVRLRMVGVDPDTVGRCVGIPDNIGKMMFEDDIIKMNGNDKDLAVIKFGEFACVSIDPAEKVDKVIGWYYTPLETDALSQVEPFCWDFQINEMWVKETDIRVIGNIHDNPELLERSAEE